jgi:hypothetical protein
MGDWPCWKLRETAMPAVPLFSAGVREEPAAAAPMEAGAEGAEEPGVHSP